MICLSRPTFIAYAVQFAVWFEYTVLSLVILKLLFLILLYRLSVNLMFCFA